MMLRKRKSNLVFSGILAAVVDVVVVSGIITYCTSNEAIAGVCVDAAFQVHYRSCTIHSGQRIGGNGNGKNRHHHRRTIDFLSYQQRPLLLHNMVPISKQGLATTTSSSSSVSHDTKKKSSSSSSSSLWYPIKPTDSLGTNYNRVVKSAYLRHVVVETEDMVDLAMKLYLRGGRLDKEDGNSSSGSSADPFGDLASDLSACSKSRNEGGKIGWVDNPYFLEQGSSTSSSSLISTPNELVQDIIPNEVISKLFLRRPKGGDIIPIQYEESRWHIIKVDDLSLTYLPNSKEREDEREEAVPAVGSQRGVNKVIEQRGKLKGLGITPQVPKMFDKDVTTQQQTQQKEAKLYHIETTGCQMNVADSERLAGILQSPPLNLQPTTSSTNADVVILNTCTIRDHAEQKVYDTLGPYAARKRKGEALALVVSGCVAQQEGEALLRRVPEVDLVMGPQYTSKLHDLLMDVERGHQIVATDPTLISEDLSRPVRGHGVRGWVNVIYGCNEHCTYCVVPGVRGLEQSRTMEHILEECLYLGDMGYKEVTLLGQNIDAYGRDMIPKRTFADLLHYLNDNLPSEGSIERIRYVTSHPRYFSDRVIDAVSDLDKVCECFHMPFQSGDDTVLKNMRRGYTYDSYMKIIDKIRTKAGKDASICGDVIVGFPGETDEAFQRTLDLMEEVQFDNLNTFAYSPRPNTEAALWSNQIPDNVKAERLQIVQRLAAQHGLNRSERYVGRTVKVLVEDRNPKNYDQVMGRTRQGRQVFFDGDLDVLLGQTVDVRILEARTWSLVGTMVEG